MGEERIDIAGSDAGCIDALARGTTRTSARDRHTATGWMLATTGSIAASQFVVFTLVARVLGVTAAGTYGLALAVVAPLSVLLGLALRPVFQAQAERWGDARAILGLRFVASGLLVVTCAATLALPSLPGLLIALLGVARAADLVGDLVLGAFLRLGRPSLGGIPVVANQVVSIAVFVVAINGFGSLTLALAGSAAASALASFVVPLALLRHEVGPAAVRATYAWAQMRPWAISGATLGLAAAVTSVAAMVPRYVVEAFLGSSAVGLFTAAFTISTVPSVFYAAITQASLTPIRRAVETGSRTSLSRAYASCARPTAAVGLMTSLIMVAAAGPLLGWAFGPEFAAAAPALRVLAVANLLGSLLWTLDVTLTALRSFAFQLVVNSATVAVIAGISFVLVPSHGIVGAAAAYAVGVGAGLVCKAGRVRGALR